MKIIQVIPRLGLAGAEIMCENLTNELIQMGCRVIVQSLYEERSPITERLEKGGTDLRYLNKKPGLDLSMIFRLYRIFKAEKPDVVHTHLYAAKYAHSAAVLAGVPCRVHTVHNIASKEAGRGARWLHRILFRFCGVVPVALSGEVRDTVMREYCLPPEKVPVVFNGADLSTCRPKTDYSCHGRFQILHIGRFSEQKNHKNLLEGFRSFHEAHPDSTLRLIGGGEKRAEMEAYVSAHGLSDCVEFLGLQADVHGFLQEADLFVLPSLWEGVPMTLIEAMGTGLPVVASAVGGVPDMIRDGESGIFCGADASSIAAALERMSGDQALRERCGANARAASARFSAAGMAEGYLAVYRGEAGSTVW